MESNRMSKNVKDNIVVVGGSAEQKRLVREAAIYYLREFLSIKELNSINILIRLRKDLYKKEKVKGDCIWEDDREDPSEFEITLDSSLRMSSLLRALAHECVHVKQYYLKELQDSARTNITHWKGKRHDTHKEKYWTLPWEIDAYGRETGLYEEFVRIKKYATAAWYVKDPDYL